MQGVQAEEARGVGRGVPPRAPRPAAARYFEDLAGPKKGGGGGATSADERANAGGERPGDGEPDQGSAPQQPADSPQAEADWGTVPFAPYTGVIPNAVMPEGAGGVSMA